MRNTFRYSFLFLIVFTLVTCKKKTSISIKLFNPLIQEYVSNAEIVLIEKKGDGGGGVLIGNSSCKEIAISVLCISAHGSEIEIKITNCTN